MNSLTTQDQLTALNEQQTAFWIYKYNANGCRLSEQTRPFVLAAEATRDIAIREIDVQTHRPLALSVAELRGIQHESPQLLYIQDGVVVAHTSHSHITPERIAQYIA